MSESLSAKGGTSMKRAIVTGPTGAVGRALVDLLLEQGVEVAAVCHRGSRRAAELFDLPGVTVVACNGSEYRTLTDMLHGSYDSLFHLAWAGTTGSARQDWDLQARNVPASVDVLDAAIALGCKTFVGAGSQAEYGAHQGVLSPDTACLPDTGYGAAKLAAGEMCRSECSSCNVKFAWCRILSAFGPYDGPKSLVSSAIEAFKRGERFSCTPGDQVWDFLYSKDVARAMILAAERGPRSATYCLGSGEARPLRDYIEEIRDVVNPDCAIGFGDIPYYPHQVMHLEADTSLLQENTGFRPAYSFREGIRETADWTFNNAGGVLVELILFSLHRFDEDEVVLCA